MEEAIRNFPKQFDWHPEIENRDKWKAFDKYLLCGMGGSHLPGDIFQTVFPGFDLSIHQDYGLPNWRAQTLKRTLIVASSYSGNTEETISSFEEAVQNGYPIAAISTGGKLLEFARQQRAPYIQVPNTGIQPRSALGFMFKALAKILACDEGVEEGTRLAKALAQKIETLASEGKILAERLRGKIPVVYASSKNYSVAYNWKIKFNETAKIPAFYNVFPELNHNEMNGFDVTDATKPLCDRFHFLFLSDAMDNPRVRKRMTVLEKQLRERGFLVEMVSLGEGLMPEKIFRSLLLADWASLHLARLYDRDPEQVPMIEEFKKLVSS